MNSSSSVSPLPSLLSSSIRSHSILLDKVENELFLKSFLDFDPNKESEIESFLVFYTGKEHFPLSPKENFEKVKTVFASLVTTLEKKSKIITIAGTNGKGEVSHSLSYLLSSKNLSCALWTSPHILSICERFSYLGENITYDDLNHYMQKAKELLLKENVFLSYYEFLFYVFLLKACDLKIDVLILEVGLGGRFDAVNVFDANFVGLTSISRDHEEILGRSYRKILNEKLGVLREKQVCFSSLELSFCREIVKERVKELGTCWHDLFEQKALNKSSSYFERNQKLAFCIANSIAPFESMPLIPLFKARREIFRLKNLNIHFIGAHNLDGIRKMKHNITTRFDKVLISFSKRPRDDLLNSLKIMLLTKESELILTAFDHDKAVKCEDLRNLKENLIETNLKFETHWGIFLDRYIKEQEENTAKQENLLLTGSYYFIGKVQRYLYLRFFAKTS